MTIEPTSQHGEKPTHQLGVFIGVGVLVIAIALTSQTILYFKLSKTLADAAKHQHLQITDIRRQLKGLGQIIVELHDRISLTPAKETNVRSHLDESKATGNPKYNGDVSPQDDEATEVTNFDIIVEMSQEELEQLNHRIKDDKLRRFFESLNEEGLRELERRVEEINDRFTKGTIPGFEGFKAPIPQGNAERDIEIRQRMEARLRRVGIIEMYHEHRFQRDMSELLKQSPDIAGP